MKCAVSGRVILSSMTRGAGAVLFLFFALIALKIALSLCFKSPWIFADETVYAETARNIIHGEFYSRLLYCQTYPPGYPLFLSVAYLFTGGLGTYHAMLFINAVLTSSIIIPSYYLLRRACPDRLSIASSLLVALVPSVFLYTFVVMSENLFIPLFVFSLWFLVGWAETGSRSWGTAAGLSVFFLFFTRTPGIAMIIGFFVALLYHLLSRPAPPGAAMRLREYLFPLAAFLIPAILWTWYKAYNGIAMISGYNNAEYLGAIQNAISSPSSFASLLVLTFHETEFLILAAFLILPVLAVFWIWTVFRSNPPIEERESLQYPLATRTGILYGGTASILLGGITVSHMYLSAVLLGDSSYSIFGRYLDPVVPLVVLAGISGLCMIRKRSYEEAKHLILACVSLTLCLVLLVLIDFPRPPFKISNLFSLYYLQSLPDITTSYLFVILLGIAVLLLFIIGMRYRKLSGLLLLFLLLFSIPAMNYTLKQEIFYSENTYESNHPLVEYLALNSSPADRVLMIPQDYSSEYGVLTWYASQFFMPGYLIQTEKELSGGQKADLILSPGILSHNVLSAAGTGFKLYDMKNRTRTIQGNSSAIHPSTDFDKTENIYPDGWTKKTSRVLIEYAGSAGDMNITISTLGGRPADSPAVIVFRCNGREIGTTTVRDGPETVHLRVPAGYLGEDFQILQIDAGTWSPKDYGVADSRVLGIRLGEITVRPATAG